MVNVKRLETIEIEATTKQEVETEINRYVELGYKQDGEISISDDKNDKYPFFGYVQKDEFE
tara:strand:- start:13023 stop:13205 length:183 start_codon:yes stop_codon:yes gene_type:complete